MPERRLPAARLAAWRAAVLPFAASFPSRTRMEADPISFAHRYARPEDQEVVALISASLAYGRVELFTPKLEALFRAMGPSPAAFCAGLEFARDAHAFEGFQYRFNLPGDLALLCEGIGELLRAHGGRLAPAFDGSLPLQEALARLLDRVRTPRRAPELLARFGPARGLAHLLPDPRRGAACKRHLLFLRWMVRGPDGIDLGLWGHVSPGALLIPLDTHVHRIARHLGFTKRSDLSWRTSEEVTAVLRAFDPLDPVRFDFPLCHHGMSGGCPARLEVKHCRACPLRSACTTGKRLLGREMAGVEGRP